MPARAAGAVGPQPRRRPFGPQAAEWAHGKATEELRDGLGSVTGWAAWRALAFGASLLAACAALALSGCGGDGDGGSSSGSRQAQGQGATGSGSAQESGGSSSGSDGGDSGSGSTGTGQRPAGPTVKLTEYEISPKRLTVHQGDSLTVVNAGEVAHNLTIEQGPDAQRVTEVLAGTPSFPPGRKFTLKVTLAPHRTYATVCTVPGHRDLGMVGKIRVEPRR